MPHSFGQWAQQCLLTAWRSNAFLLRCAAWRHERTRAHTRARAHTHARTHTHTTHTPHTHTTHHTHTHTCMLSRWNANRKAITCGASGGVPIVVPRRPPVIGRDREMLCAGERRGQLRERTLRQDQTGMVQLNGKHSHWGPDGRIHRGRTGGGGHEAGDCRAQVCSTTRRCDEAPR